MGEAWAVVPAGGRGQRFSQSADKLLARFAGKPVLVHTLQALLSSERINGAVVAAHPDQLAVYQAALEEVRPRKPVLFVPGGATRRESVRLGLAAAPQSADIVAVHDAARPLIRPAIVNEAVRRVEAGVHLSILVAIPVVDTVKEADPETGRVKATVDRRRLWQAQTPQVFWRSVLTQAHDSVPPDQAVTDDVQLVELAGLGEIAIVEGEARNLKITTPGDIRVAEALLEEWADV